MTAHSSRKVNPTLERRYWIAAAVLVVVVHAALWTVYYYPETKELMGDEGFYWQSATAFVAGEEPETDVLWSSFYPRLLAVTGGSLVAVQIAQSLMLVACALLLRSIVRALGASDQAAAFAAFLMLAYPPLAAFSHYLWPEILHLLILLAAWWVLTVRAESLAWMIPLGGLLGLALLTKSLLMPFLPVLLVPLLLVGRRRLVRVSIVVAVLAAVVAPTSFRNHREFGTWLPLDNASFNVWVGLTERSRTNFEDSIVASEYLKFRESAATHLERRRILNQNIVEFVRETGWIDLFRAQASRQYSRLLDKDSFLIVQLPGGPIYSDGLGYQQTPTWLAVGLRALSYALYGLVLLTAPFGLLSSRWLRRPLLGLAVAFIVYNLAVFLLVHVKTRYMLQLLPFLFVGSVLAFDRLRGWRRDPPSRWVVVASVAISLLLLFVAFSPD